MLTSFGPRWVMKTLSGVLLPWRSSLLYMWYISNTDLLMRPPSQDHQAPQLLGREAVSSPVFSQSWCIGSPPPPGTGWKLRWSSWTEMLLKIRLGDEISCQSLITVRYKGMMSTLYSTPSKGEAVSVQQNVSTYHFIREGSVLFQKQIRLPVDERDI